MIIRSGIADEAGRPIEVQIRAQKELGWNHIELRRAQTNQRELAVTMMEDGDFDRVFGAISESGLTVVGLASKIGDWSRLITGDFQTDCGELHRAIPRMQRFNPPVNIIRIMSWPNRALDYDNWYKEVVYRLRHLIMIVKGESDDIILAMENCSGLCTQARLSSQIIQEIGSARLRILFDTGNPVEYGENSFAEFEIARHLAFHFHVKDAVKLDDGLKYTLPGEGNGHVEEILRAIAGLPGDHTVSIEPHLEDQIHKGTTADPNALYSSYIKYGQAFNRLLEQISTPATNA